MAIAISYKNSCFVYAPIHHDNFLYLQAPYLQVACYIRLSYQMYYLTLQNNRKQSRIV